jgi:hypothetical protein
VEERNWKEMSCLRRGLLEVIVARGGSFTYTLYRHVRGHVGTGSREGLRDHFEYSMCRLVRDKSEMIVGAIGLKLLDDEVGD